MTMRRIAGACVLATVAGCNFDVTNPGPVQEKFLDDPAAQTAVVNGAGRDLSDALNWTAYTSGAVAREIFPAGSTGSFGISSQQQIGRLIPEETDAYWNRAQRARWEAENGLARFKETMTADAYGKSKNVAQLLVWAGYANRLLGESMCDAVIDGGAKQAYTVFLTRAEAQFTEAMSVATAAGDSKTAQAAQAGRASVRLDLGNLSGAASDAAALPDAFVYQMPYYTTDADQYNRIYWATANSPYRAHTTWNTFYQQYYTDSKDPRVAWVADPKNPVGDAAVLQLGRVPWYSETKFGKKDAGINLSSGWEMRLIEAEAKLKGGDVTGALTLINKHRVALGLTPWTAANAVDAWTALKRERGIELWLEARRLSDLRRWKATSTPGTLSDFEIAGNAKSYLDAAQDLCYPTPLSETQTNPNLKG
jgi:starch-binding outer membrane protein, SusD/RagB family